MLFNRRLRYTGPNRRIAKVSPLMLAAAALGLAAIAYATLCPLGMRPRLANPDIERFGAFFVLGLLASLAAPRRGVLVPTIVVLVAFGLEAAQLLIPGRDGVFSDACVKATGGVVGAQVGFATFAARRLIGQWLTISGVTTHTVETSR